MKKFPVPKLEKWMELSTTSEKKLLAKLADISYTHLYRLLDGSRVASTETAAAISIASREIYIKGRKHLFVLQRSDLSPACRSCPYSPGCGK